MALHGPHSMESRPVWFDPIGTLSFSLSLAVNAIFTGLLVYKIAKASLALRHTHAGGIGDFTPLISLLIESGLVFFLVQLVYVVCFNVDRMGFTLISGPFAIIYVCAYLHLLLSFINILYRDLYRQLLWCVLQWQVPQIRHVTRVQTWKVIWSLHTPMSTSLQKESQVRENMSMHNPIDYQLEDWLMTSVFYVGIIFTFGQSYIYQSLLYI